MNRRIDPLSRSVPDLVAIDCFDRISADGESEIGDEVETEFMYEFINGNLIIIIKKCIFSNISNLRFTIKQDLIRNYWKIYFLANNINAIQVALHFVL